MKLLTGTPKNDSVYRLTLEDETVTGYFPRKVEICVFKKSGHQMAILIGIFEKSAYENGHTCRDLSKKNLPIGICVQYASLYLYKLSKFRSIRAMELSEICSICISTARHLFNRSTSLSCMDRCFLRILTNTFASIVEKFTFFDVFC